MKHIKAEVKMLHSMNCKIYKKKHFKVKDIQYSRLNVQEYL